LYFLPFIQKASESISIFVDHRSAGIASTGCRQGADLVSYICDGHEFFLFHVWNIDTLSGLK
jgi:hypothetical protein